MNHKVFLVANSCHHNENSKNGKNRLQTNTCHSRANPTNPHPHPHPPWAKAKMQKPQGGGKFLCKSFGGAQRNGYG